MKELPLVVWSLRTTPSRATGFTPFFLVYGAEAILPTDLEYGSPKTRTYDARSNQTNREDSLDQLEESWDMALLGALATTRCQRAPQAHTSLGRAVHHRQDFEAWNIQAGQQSRRGLQQRLEHLTSTSLLPLRCFQVIHIPRLHTQIKSNHQGRVSLASTKPDPPSGARRGEPPLRQNFPRKKSSTKATFVFLGYISNRTPRNE
jgi:hypothetical protein